MCGILGQVTRRKAEEGPFRDGLSRLRHRGPDGEGIRRVEIGASQVLLGHARLSVLDHQGGAQPMQDAENHALIVFNGEVYNHPDLRERLSQARRFLSDHSDTEAVLNAYLEWGDDFVLQLDGMFALAILDLSRSRLLLARDRFGIKPLYYSHNDGDFCFASELQALAPLHELTIKPEHLRHYWHGDAIPAPLTPYEGVFKVMPGQLVVHDLDSGRTTLQQWHRYQRCPVPNLSFDEALERFIPIAETAIETYARADVEISVLLSGGVDSSLVAGSLARNGMIKRAFHVPSRHHQEDGRNARALAKKYGFALEEVTGIFDYGFEEALGVFERLDEPMADMSLLPSALVCQAVCRAGVKSVLTGDGADELAGGYSNYATFSDMERSSTSLASRVMQALTRRPPLDLFARYRASCYNPDYVRSFSKDGIVPDVAWPTPRASQSVLDYISEDQVDRLLRNDILVKMDRASMMSSVEVRLPFLANGVADFLAATPFSILMRHGGKGLLKAYLHRQDGDVVDAFGVKRGFTVDYEHLTVQKKFAPFIRDLAKDCPYLLPLSDQTYSAMTPKQSWRLFIFLAWWQAERRWREVPASGMRNDAAPHAFVEMNRASRH